MSWTRFDNSTRSWSDKRLREEILKLFSQSRDKKTVYGFNHLYEIVRPHNATQLALVLAELVKSGELRQFVRVESPQTHNGIEDFSSITDVPAEVHDFYSDSWFNVQPENLRVMYTLRG